MSFWKHCQWHC